MRRWSGKDIWLNGLRLTLPGCTLTIMGNIQGLQSQLSADAAPGFFTEFTVKVIFGQLLFPHNKTETVLKTEPKRILNFAFVTGLSLCVFDGGVLIAAFFLSMIVYKYKHSKISQIKYSRFCWETHIDFGNLKQGLQHCLHPISKGLLREN